MCHQPALLPEPLPSEPLPELATVYWRPRADERRLGRTGRLWTACTLAHTVPFVAAAALLTALKPITAPVSLILLAHAWIIPELYAARGAGVVRPPREVVRSPSVRRAAVQPANPGSEQRALLLLGDLLDHAARDLYLCSGLVLERGSFGTWLIAEAGAILVRPGGRRVHCYCVKATGEGLPRSDRVAHLLLALRADESGFATVANLAFSGAAWRLARRLPVSARAALCEARRTVSGPQVTPAARPVIA